MNYSLNKNIWQGIAPYNLNGNLLPISHEGYGGPVTLSLPEWRKYVADGNNTLLGSGGVIPGGTVSTPFGGNAVYAGSVRQGIAQG